MGDLSEIFNVFKEKIMFKNHQTKTNQSPKEKEVDTNGPPVCAPDYSATGLAAKMGTNSQWAFYAY